MKKLVFILGILIILAVSFMGFKPSAKQNNIPIKSEAPQISIVAQNLDTPWSIVFLPDKSMLVAERPGRVRLIENNTLQPEPVITLNSIKEIGEGGLLGMAIHPNFSANKYVYLYYTYSENNQETLNRVVRMTYENKILKDEKIIVDKIPGASNHNGGRIKFGPDNYLYITTGDAQNPSQAQDINALGGKILRVTDEGKAVLDNPFNNLIYSYGHRNSQGLAWDRSGQLWSTEHGRSGLQSGFDELNLIEKGKNYGWPDIEGDETGEGLETPKLNSGTNSTWAPAGLAYISNILFFGGLRGQTLYQADINGEKITLKEHFSGQFGRIRDVVVGPDKMLYITTSNQDGRGNPNAADDKIIKINPSNFFKFSNGR